MWWSVIRSVDGDMQSRPGQGASKRQASKVAPGASVAYTPYVRLVLASVHCCACLLHKIYIPITEYMYAKNHKLFPSVMFAVLRNEYHESLRLARNHHYIISAYICAICISYFSVQFFLCFRFVNLCSRNISKLHDCFLKDNIHLVIICKK